MSELDKTAAWYQEAVRRRNAARAVAMHARRVASDADTEALNADRLVGVCESAVMSAAAGSVYMMGGKPWPGPPWAKDGADEQ